MFNVILKIILNILKYYKLKLMVVVHLFNQDVVGVQMNGDVCLPIVMMS